jgi:hypothetical protein
MSATDVNTSNIILGHGHLYVDGTSVGGTSGGVNVAKSTTTYEIYIDQLTTPVRSYPVKEDFTVKTNISEATLQNLAIVWNVPASQITGNTMTVGVSTGVLEHKLTITGVAPNGKTRIIQIFRAVSVQASEHGYFKDKETLYPVTFTCLADTTRAPGNEFCTIYEV